MLVLPFWDDDRLLLGFGVMVGKGSVFLVEAMIASLLGGRYGEQVVECKW
jgi:hypothetical protein